MRLVACGRRSSDFGVMMISGRCLAIARLAAQQVEVLRRRRQVGDADVALGGELQEALQARRGVLGARALVAVRAAAASGACVWPHLARPETMNWSMMTCAPLAKSPNCASHSTSVSGASAE